MAELAENSRPVGCTIPSPSLAAAIIMKAMYGNDWGALYAPEELRLLLGSVGENVAVNRSVVFYSPKNVHLGSNVRIDCFSLLTAGDAGIVIEDHVHLSAYCFLVGSAGKIHLQSFSGLAARVSLFTATDDYSEGFLTNPTVPARYKKVRSGDIVLQKHALVGSGSVLMPGVTLGTAASVGALSFVNKSVPEFAIVSGNPIRVVGRRNRRILELEQEFTHEKPGRD